MKMHDKLDWAWLLRYRLLVRLGRDPLVDKKGRRRIFRRIGSRPVRGLEQANCMLHKVLGGERRFFVARLGYTEARTFGLFRQYQLGFLDTFPNECREHAKNSSGIFTNNDEGLKLFCEELANGLSKVTHLAVFSTEYEPLLIKHYGKHAVLFRAQALEHFRYSPSWMEGLRNKKVLVVSMFAETVEKQYQKRNDLFPDNPSANPLFISLDTFKAEVTYGIAKPRFPTWKDTLDYMFEECMKRDFDVAILSCGGYGLPLGAMLYNAGKSVIHSGGITQMYFGIYGERYDNEKYRQFIGSNWVRPSGEERTKGFETIENGAYW